jgi:hypothetical protein
MKKASNFPRQGENRFVLQKTSYRLVGSIRIHFKEFIDVDF